MADPKPHIELAYSCIKCFADDGTLDTVRNFLFGIAMRDGVVDEDEKRVLKNIFSKVRRPEVTSVVWERMEEVKRVHGIAD